MTLYEMIEHCQKRGKMTELEAQKLRSSIHVFVGPSGQKSLAAYDVPAWLETHCKNCPENCPVKVFLKNK